MEVDGYRVQLVFEEHPKTGPNEIGIRIIHPDGSPLLGAVVKVASVPATEEHSVDETGSHGDVHGQLTEIHPEANNEPGDEMEYGHSASPTMDEHGDGKSVAESHSEMETEVHEETGSHNESGSVVLTATGEEGHYTGKISFSEPGSWSVSVRILPEGERVEKELNFPVDVIASGPPWEVLSGFFGINLIVVAVAGFLKRKPSAAKS